MSRLIIPINTFRPALVNLDGWLKKEVIDALYDLNRTMLYRMASTDLEGPYETSFDHPEFKVIKIMSILLEGLTFDVVIPKGRQPKSLTIGWKK